MRRGPARLLLLVFTFGLIAPVLLLAGRDGGEPKVPACCRKDGKHKCSMRSVEPSSPAPGVSAGRVQCPMYREMKSPPATDAYGLSIVLAFFSFDLPAARADQAASPAPAATSVHDSHEQRGPPSTSAVIL